MANSFDISGFKWHFFDYGNCALSCSSHSCSLPPPLYELNLIGLRLSLLLPSVCSEAPKSVAYITLSFSWMKIA
jgi:hypothetical protein